MAQYHYFLEHNSISEILADFHTDDDLFNSSYSFSKESASGEKLSAEAKIVGSKTTSRNSINTLFYFSNFATANPEAKQKNYYKVNYSSLKPRSDCSHEYNNLIKNEIRLPYNSAKSPNNEIVGSQLIPLWSSYFNSPKNDKNLFGLKINKVATDEKTKIAEQEHITDLIPRCKLSQDFSNLENKCEEFYNPRIGNNFNNVTHNEKLKNQQSIKPNDQEIEQINKINRNVEEEARTQINKGRVLNGATIVNGVNLANLKFVKPASQCFFWQNPRHRLEQPSCRLWHPKELCKYYPKCTLTAEVCGFGHPFCGEYCTCLPKKRSLQKNHRIVPYYLQQQQTRVTKTAPIKDQ